MTVARSACRRVGSVCPAGGGVAERSLEPVAQTAVEAREEVAVAVESEADGGVAHALLDLLRVCPLGDEQRGTGMP